MKDKNKLRMKEKNNPAINWAGRADTDKGRCKVTRKHYFSQGQSAAVKCCNSSEGHCFLANDAPRPALLLRTPNCQTVLVS